MHVGQKVYVQKVEIQFHKWYKGHITHIRLQSRPVTCLSPFRCMWHLFTCYTCAKLEYVIQLQDGSTVVVGKERIELNL